MPYHASCCLSVHMKLCVSKEDATVYKCWERFTVSCQYQAPSFLLSVNLNTLVVRGTGLKPHHGVGDWVWVVFISWLSQCL